VGLGWLLGFEGMPGRCLAGVRVAVGLLIS
jgi:hypothetical protein